MLHVVYVFGPYSLLASSLMWYLLSTLEGGMKLEPFELANMQKPLAFQSAWAKISKTEFSKVRFTNSD